MQEQNSLPIETDYFKPGSIEEVDPPELVDPPGIYYYPPEDLHMWDKEPILTREHRSTGLLS